MFSNHALIKFDLVIDNKVQKIKDRNLQKADWKIFRDFLDSCEWTHPFEWNRGALNEQAQYPTCS